MRKLSLLATLLFGLGLYGCGFSPDAPEPNGNATSISTMMDNDDYAAELFDELEQGNLDEDATSLESDEPIDDIEGFDDLSADGTDAR